MRLPRPWNPAYKPVYDAMTDAERRRSLLFDLSLLAVALVFIFFTGPADAQTFPDRGRAAVVDAADVIPDHIEADLNERIIKWNLATENQLVVATVPDLGGREISDYGYRLGRHWGLGRGTSAADSTGVILLLAPKERKVRIDVGYGLEPVLTDADTRRIIAASIVPYLKGGQPGEALSIWATSIMHHLDVAGMPVPLKAKAPEKRTGVNIWLVMLGGLFVFGAILFLIIRRETRKWEEDARRMREYNKREWPGGFSQQADLVGEMIKKSRKANMSKSMGETYGSKSRAKPVSVDETRHTRPDPFPTPTPTPTPTPSSYDWGSSSSSSSDSGSSSSGFDSGGGSFGGGGSDSSY